MNLGERTIRRWDRLSVGDMVCLLFPAPLSHEPLPRYIQYSQVWSPACLSGPLYFFHYAVFLGRLFSSLALSFRDMGTRHSGEFPENNKTPPLPTGKFILSVERIHWAFPGCALEEAFPMLGISWAHITCVLSQCAGFPLLTCCFCFWLCPSFRSFYDKSLPSTLAKPSSWTVRGRMQKEALHYLHLLLLPRVHFMI